MYCTVPGCPVLYLFVISCVKVYCTVRVHCTEPGCTVLYPGVLYTVPGCTVLVVLLVNYSSPRGLKDECIQIWSFRSIQPKQEKETDYLYQNLSF